MELPPQFCVHFTRWPANSAEWVCGGPSQGSCWVGKNMTLNENGTIASAVDVSYAYENALCVCKEGFSGNDDFISWEGRDCHIDAAVLGVFTTTNLVVSAATLLAQLTLLSKVLPKNHSKKRLRGTALRLSQARLR